jgi:hypothetical protein
MKRVGDEEDNPIHIIFDSAYTNNWIPDKPASDKQDNRMHANLWIRLAKHLDGIKIEFSTWRTLLIFILKRDPLYQIEVSPFPCVDKSKVV